MRLNIFIPLICLLGLVYTTSSCRLPTEELTPLEMEIVDTLYNSALPEYRKEIDSLCQLTRDSFIKIKADSLVELQLQEIKKLINRK